MMSLYAWPSICVQNSESESDEQLLGGAQPPTDSGTTGGETEGGGGARGGAAPSETSGTGRGSSSKKEAKGEEGELRTLAIQAIVLWFSRLDAQHGRLGQPN